MIQLGLLNRWQKWREKAKTPLQLELRQKPTQAKCPCCGETVVAWRRYADGRKECIACADKVK